MSQPSAPEPLPPLLPRFRRPLTFGAVLDETIGVYRGAFLSVVGISALWSLPSVLAVALFGVGELGGLDSLPFDPEDPASMGRFATGAAVAGLGAGLLSAVFALIGYGAIVAFVDRFLRGERRSIAWAFGVGLRRALLVLVAGIAVAIAATLLAIASLVLMVLTLVVVGILVSLIGLTVWWLNPAARRPWLKWLIVLTTPFGLVAYFTVRWSLYVQAIVLEGAGAFGSLDRSGTLATGAWFRIFGVFLVIGFIQWALQIVPTAIAGAIAGFAAADGDGLLTANILLQSVNFLGSTLFGSLAYIGGTILFEDLRNRREGTDLEERLASLEPQPAPLT